MTQSTPAYRLRETWHYQLELGKTVPMLSDLRDAMCALQNGRKVAERRKDLGDFGDPRMRAIAEYFVLQNLPQSRAQLCYGSVGTPEGMVAEPGERISFELETNMAGDEIRVLRERVSQTFAKLGYRENS